MNNIAHYVIVVTLETVAKGGIAPDTYDYNWFYLGNNRTTIGIHSYYTLVTKPLKINAGGDFGPMEWFQERTESVFNSVSVDSIKEAMGRYCLDEGIGLFDKNRTSNLQTANNGVAHSKDSRLQELVNSKNNRIPTGVKR